MTEYKWIYQIRAKMDLSFSAQTEFVGLSKKSSKQEVLDEIKLEFPEYFYEQKTVPQRSKLAQPLLPFVKIYPSSDYWENVWLERFDCIQCGNNSKTRLELTNLSISKNDYLCSDSCIKKYHTTEEKEKRYYETIGREMSEKEEYFNGVCPNYYIYKITNKENEKVYIGFTERQPFFRWYEHLVRSNQPFGKVLKERGIKEFTFEVLEEVDKKISSIQKMHEMESDYIREYDSINNGYNVILSSTLKYQEENNE
jgi:hypothetical protein